MSERRLSIRLSEEEWQKLTTVENRAKERNRGYAPLAHVVKELIGLWPMNLTIAEDRPLLLGSAPESQDPPLPVTVARIRVRHK